MSTVVNGLHLLNLHQCDHYSWITRRGMWECSNHQTLSAIICCSEGHIYKWLWMKWQENTQVFFLHLHFLHKRDFVFRTTFHAIWQKFHGIILSHLLSCLSKCTLRNLPNFIRHRLLNYIWGFWGHILWVCLLQIADCDNMQHLPSNGSNGNGTLNFHLPRFFWFIFF